jgi:hypothetical protein
MKDGGPAFPHGMAYHGMTLRDYFAAQALCVYRVNGDKDKKLEECVEAYAWADAMLEVRNK